MFHMRNRAIATHSGGPRLGQTQDLSQDVWIRSPEPMLSRVSPADFLHGGRHALFRDFIF